MRTEDLIRALSADTVPQPRIAPTLGAAVAVAALLVAVVALPLLGLRPQMALETLVIKLVFPMVVAAAAAAAALRLTAPGGSVGGFARAAIGLVPVFVLMAVLVELAGLPRPDWRPALMGQSAMACLLLVPMMSVPLLGATLWALSGGASTRPVTSGVLAGLISGGVAATIYAMHCNEDSPLFYLAWYGLALVIVAGLGGLAGRRFLRW